MDRIFKISQGIRIDVKDSGKKGAYELGQVIEFKTTAGEFQERFYPNLTQEAIEQVLKSNGVEVSNEDFLESFLELDTKNKEKFEKILEGIKTSTKDKKTRSKY